MALEASSHDFTGAHLAGYESDGDHDEAARPRMPMVPPKYRDQGEKGPVPGRGKFVEEESYIKAQDHALRRQYAPNYRAMNAWDRHQQLVGDYLKYYGGSLERFRLMEEKRSREGVTDQDILRQEFRFVRSPEEDADAAGDYGKRLARKYYDRLFKEYCLADMRFYKQSKIGMRWRTKAEVVQGKGQFSCGNKVCKESKGLRSFEVNFAYVEHKKRKSALVKLRLCPRCAYKLNYRKIKEMEKAEMAAAAAASGTRAAGETTHSKRARSSRTERMMSEPEMKKKKKKKKTKQKQKKKKKKEEEEADEAEEEEEKEKKEKKRRGKHVSDSKGSEEVKEFTEKVGAAPPATTEKPWVSGPMTKQAEDDLIAELLP